MPSADAIISINDSLFFYMETVYGAVESEIAAHDYRHEGYMVRRLHLGHHQYAIYVGPPRRTTLRCCTPLPMRGVSEHRVEVRERNIPCRFASIHSRQRALKTLAEKMWE
jgi:hypothetical protein